MSSREEILIKLILRDTVRVTAVYHVYHVAKVTKIRPYHEKVESQISSLFPYRHYIKMY